MNIFLAFYVRLLRWCGLTYSAVRSRPQLALVLGLALVLFTSPAYAQIIGGGIGGGGIFAALYTLFMSIVFPFLRYGGVILIGLSMLFFEFTLKKVLFVAGGIFLIAHATEIGDALSL